MYSDSPVGQLLHSTHLNFVRTLGRMLQFSFAPVALRPRLKRLTQGHTVGDSGAGTGTQITKLPHWCPCEGVFPPLENRSSLPMSHPAL